MGMYPRLRLSVGEPQMAGCEQTGAEDARESRCCARLATLAHHRWIQPEGDTT